MAQIYKGDSKPEKAYADWRTLFWIAAVSAALFLCLFTYKLLSGNFDRWIFLIVIAFGLSSYATKWLYQKMNAFSSGIHGESETARIISILPDSYRGYQNLKVKFNGGVSELDMVVVGPTGVFVIETKNMKGYIMGSYNNPQWVQHKVGRGGTPYSKNFYSPVKQVGTHVYRLANFLRGHSCRVYVDAMVYFSNPATTVQLTGVPTTISVFSANANGAQGIYDRILSNDRVLSDDVISRIHALLIDTDKRIKEKT